ncbi:TPA: response regulator [Candidatus Scatenecus faecavium]|uniref:Response regulator n=1 Tax=Candidatus Scatenecus faecavium TaxID=2840915 RepID=A0A9D1FXC0_9BACT|nr:response regulator [Candidatus Scatenecus faecavium]
MQSVTLIIDKRRELSVKYKKLLENELSSVIISKNLISSMKLIQDKEPDLIIVSDSIDEDLGDFCKKIRALTYNMRPVIVALSKSAELQDRLNVLSCGADDFLSEPVNNEEFTMRMKAHLRREFESNLDAKRLLPNKNYSMRALKRILTAKEQWGCLYISIENFKNYRENYTELASDKLIQTYCAIMQSSLNEDDYLGGISENEFLIITNPLKAEKIANFLVFAFDAVAKKFYSLQDRERGYIIMNGDELAGRRSNFVHTTIGIVTNEFQRFSDTKQLFASLISIHDLANLPDRSNYLIERAKISGQNAVEEKAYNNKIVIIEPDEAMNILLKTILELQGYEVLTASVFEEVSEQPAVIILDAGSADSLKGLDLCKTLRQNSEFSGTKLIVTSILHDKELILNCGADLYLPKPYELSNLIKWVKFFVDEVNFR